MDIRPIRADPKPPPIARIDISLDTAEAFGLMCYLRNARKHYAHGGQPGSDVAYGADAASEFIDGIEHLRLDDREER